MEMEVIVTMFLKNQSRWKAVILDLDGTLLHASNKIVARKRSKFELNRESVKEFDKNF